MKPLRDERGRARSGRARARSAPRRPCGRRSARRRAARRAPWSNQPSPPMSRWSRGSKPRSRRSPTARSSSASSSVPAVGRGRVGRVRDLVEELRRARPRPRASSLLERLAARSLIRVSSSSCSGVGLPFSFVRARSSSTCGWSCRHRSSAREQLVEELRRRPCARARRGRRRDGRALPEVDHAVSLP